MKRRMRISLGRRDGRRERRREITAVAAAAGAATAVAATIVVVVVVAVGVVGVVAGVHYELQIAILGNQSSFQETLTQSGRIKKRKIGH